MNLSRCFLATTAATAVVSVFSLPAQAAVLSFGTNGITVDQATTVRFTFTGSNHFYESVLSVFVTNSSGTYVDKTSQSNLFSELSGPIAPGTVRFFTFRPDFVYTLGLTNYNPNTNALGLAPNVFSTTASNNSTNIVGPGNASQNYGQQRALFGYTGTNPEGNRFPNPGLFVSADPTNGPVRISFEDGGFNGTTSGSITAPNDGDFNDFIFTAEVVPIPIPPPLAGLLVFGTLSFLRRRQTASSETSTLNDG
ncbi:DUF4114 domain-containing protein [Kovacikia minuta CCNUW1]|uniref:DUF4114 domain-containing protein n=1 Tax=Kovacikia minuta TaxID=2931930 RepID=UPI001CC9FAFF|nr:DUF4114 domain-containing protein [Kovacikia minuta]UBF29430.1 DUF4114 domain-containing protein [Kovacikia minuta CCNUW1]